MEIVSPRGTYTHRNRNRYTHRIRYWTCWDVGDSQAHATYTPSLYSSFQSPSNLQQYSELSLTLNTHPHTKKTKEAITAHHIRSTNCTYNMKLSSLKNIHNQSHHPTNQVRACISHKDVRRGKRQTSRKDQDQEGYTSKKQQSVRWEQRGYRQRGYVDRIAGSKVVR